MSRYIRGDLRVRLRPGGNAPAEFVWERRRYGVQQVLLVWKEHGCWWDGEGERTCFRVAAVTGEECGVEALSRENAALRERLAALEALEELVGEVVDELIAEPIERV